jgi:CTP:molybdopterin cytidylyltransferase MocA
MTRSAPTTPRRVAAVLLAAGGSRRLGTPKQLVRWRSRPLLVQALDALNGALPGGPLVVVLGDRALRLRGVIRRTVPAPIVVTNARWADGLATSLKAGIAAVPPGTRAILVALVDQPNVDAHALRRLLRAWRRKPGTPAAARYDGRAGVPAVLPRSSWRAARALTGDSGARGLLRAAGASLTLVDMPEAELDVDTAADLEHLSRRRASRS